MSTSDNSKSLNIKEIKSGTSEIAEVDAFHTLIIEDVKYKTRLTKKYLRRKAYEPVDPKKILSFIPGTIKKIYAKKGGKVKAGDKLIDLEAMKMLNTIFANENGVVEDIYIKEGDMVPKSKVLILFK